MFITRVVIATYALSAPASIKVAATVAAAPEYTSTDHVDSAAAVAAVTVATENATPKQEKPPIWL